MKRLSVLVAVLLGGSLALTCFALDHQIQADGQGDFTLNSQRMQLGVDEGVITQARDKEEVRGVDGSYSYSGSADEGRQATFNFTGDESMINSAQMSQAFGWSQRGGPEGIAQAFIGEVSGRNSLFFQGTGTPGPDALSGLVEMESDVFGRVGVSEITCSGTGCSDELTEASYRDDGRLGLNIPRSPEGGPGDRPWYDDLGDICRDVAGPHNLNPWAGEPSEAP